MTDNKFSSYDHEKLCEARDILQKVLDYNYCDPKIKRLSRRLDTVVIKLNELIQLSEEE